MIAWAVDESEAAMADDIIEKTIKGIRDNTVEGKNSLNLSDYHTTTYEYGVDVPKHGHLDFGNDNKFDISYKIFNLLSDNTKNKIKISEYTEEIYNRKYDNVNGQCLTISFNYKDRNGIGLEMAVPVAQKQKFKDYLFAALFEKIEEASEKAIDYSNSWSSSSFTCNVAVRTHLYYYKNYEKVLFPKKGSGLTKVSDEGANFIRGEIDKDGLADDIYEDLVTDNEHTSYFEELEKESNDSWKTFFDNIQAKANSGEIIIGIIHSNDRPTTSHGHIVAIMPESLSSEGKTTINIGGIFYKPIALEAGTSDKEIVPIKALADQLVKYKWFKYLK